MRVAAPLLRPAMFRDRSLTAGFAMSGLVATVMMTTLVVGPFYLARALGLDAAMVGITLSAGPAVAALSGVPAGRVVDRFGAQRMTVAGLLAMTAGAALLAAMPAAFGVPGYVGALVVLTAGYALFQAANNTAVMMGVAADRRGVVSGLLNLSRSLGLITGASAMGAVFAFAAGADVATAAPAAVAAGMHITFAVAAALIVIAVAVAMASRAKP
jgi:MFS family permease